jgi:hypothetical protein
MKPLFLLLSLLLTVVALGRDSVLLYRADVRSFFDNKPYYGSAYQTPQTQAGTRLAPQLGLSWDNQRHRVLAGVNAMHEWGSDKLTDDIVPIAYYEFNSSDFRFMTGAFPMRQAVIRYPRMFYKGMLYNYRPVMNGVFWEFHRRKNYVNAWLDVTSRQTDTRRKALVAGWSGRAGYGDFYAQHFGYMGYFADAKKPLPYDETGGTHDNGLLLVQAGIDLAERTGLDKLDVNVGWAAGLERERTGDSRWHLLNGFLTELKVEYRGLGIFNTFYGGSGQQYFAADPAHAAANEPVLLYWGDAFYRAPTYDRLNCYIIFFDTDIVQVQALYALQFVERKVYHQQLLNVSFVFDNIKKGKIKPYQYLWDRWLK